MLDLLAAVDHISSRRAVASERAFLAEVGGGCDLPVGAYATEVTAGELRLTGLIASLDGSVLVRHAGEGPDPEALGRAVGRHLLDECGGRSLLGHLALA